MGSWRAVAALPGGGAAFGFGTAVPVPANGVLVVPQFGQTPSLTLVEPATASLATMGWDGEAFEVTGQAPGVELQAARVATDGTLLLPYTPYGQVNSYIAPNRADGPDVATDPVTGRTWAVSDWADANLLSHFRLTGHERRGEPLAGLPDAGYVSIPNGGWVTVTRTRLAAVPDGVWVAWFESEARIEESQAWFLRISADITPRSTTSVTAFPDPTGLWDHGVTPTPSGDIFYVMATGEHMYWYDVREGAISAPTRFFEGPRLNGLIYGINPVTNGQERWVGFMDGVLVRLVRLAPGCVYGPARQPLPPG